MGVKRDRLLYEILSRLETTAKPYASEEALIHDAVAAYMAHLMESGNVPFRFLDELEKDLTEESWDIIRKKTYGAQGLRDYRRSSERKKRARAS